jgi:hypothetical protein
VIFRSASGTVAVCHPEIQSVEPGILPTLMTLLLRPQIEIGEGPQGYLARLAETNRLSISDLTRIGIVFDADNLRAQRCLSARGTNSSLDRYLDLIGAELSNRPGAWIRRSSRCCPRCLQDLAQWRVSWELLFADACPTHGLWLIDQCTKCGEALTWQRSTRLRCSCGQPLAQQAAGLCPESVRRLSSVLDEKLLGQLAEHGFGPIDGLDLGQLQRLIRFLGCYADPSPGPRPQKIPRLERLSTSWRLTSLAAEIFHDWPVSLYAVLDRMQRERVDTGGGRLPGRFGYFYTALYRGFPEDVFAKLREAFENYVAEHWRGALSLRNRRFPPGLLHRAAWIPANHACDQLKISRRRLIELIAEEKISGETRKGPTGRKFIVVLRRDVEQQLTILAQEVSLIEVAAMLGLTKRRMQALLPLLFPEARRTGSAGVPWAIPRQRADRLLQIIEGTQKINEVPDGFVSIAHVLRFWAWSDGAVVDLLSDVISGAVVPRLAIAGEYGVPALVVRTQDLRDWHARTHQTSCSTLSIPDVAERIGVKQEVAYAIVRAGLLPTTKMDAGMKRDGQGVTPAALETFGQLYIFARDLAKELGRSPKTVIEQLRVLGVQPVCGPEVDGCRQFVYRKESALTFAVDAIRRIRSKQS